MDEIQLLDTVLASTFVKADVLRRLRIVREYLEQRFFTPGEKKDLSDYFVVHHVSVDDQVVIKSWDGGFFKSFNKENAYDFLDKMSKRVNVLPTVNMYVPIVLDAGQTAKIGQWMRENIDKEVLIELHIEPSSFGGCAFAYNGVYSDYSLRHYMHKNMDGIRKVLDGYATNKP